MKVSGFTFIKNALIYDYPIVEAIKSILPLCNEFIVAVGKSEDDTLALIRSIDSPKIKILATEWNNDLREGGRVLAEETNKAFENISKDSDWAFYIQADEILHEKYLDIIYNGMKKYKNDKSIDALLFSYLHFYGSYDYVGTSSKWYNKEIRVIKNDKSIYSYKDAQGFRKGDNQKLNVKAIDAYIYHYGWVKEPKTMQRKQKYFNTLWHEDQWILDNVSNTDSFDYTGNAEELSLFKASHPKLMQKRIEAKNWEFKHDLSFNRLPLKDRLKRILLKYFGLNFYYKNYRLK